MALPRMTTRRWMLVIAVVAIDLYAIFQRYSDPLAYLSVATTCAVILFSIPMLVLLAFVEDA
jgi:hypothetical protein